MFSYHIGFPVDVDGREFLHVCRGALGHAVFGPYDHVRPGLFRVEFDIALAEGDVGDPDESVAVIDIAAYRGAVVLASRELRRSDLSVKMLMFSLDLTNREFRSLEYRVATPGTAALLVGHPRLMYLSDVLPPSSAADPTQDTADPVEQQRQTRAVLGLLRPQRVRGFGKVRLGNAGDGGYVCLDDFRRGDIALSLGINDDITWDLDAADRGMIIHQFDHTVDDPAPQDARMIFNKKMIAAYSSSNSASLPDLIRIHDRAGSRPNMMLKMDIEGGEWPALEVTSAKELSRFSQILCELHCFEQLVDAGARRLIYSSLLKIYQNFAVVHVHGNSCGGLVNLNNLVIPRVMEFTFVNRSLYDLEDTDELFPGPLDISCDAYQPDIYLGSFRF